MTNQRLRHFHINNQSELLPFSFSKSKSLVQWKNFGVLELWSCLLRIEIYNTVVETRKEKSIYIWAFSPYHFLVENWNYFLLSLKKIMVYIFLLKQTSGKHVLCCVNIWLVIISMTKNDNSKHRFLPN